MTMPFYDKDAARNEGDEQQLKTQFANQVSLMHLGSLGIDWKDQTVLDVGCGVSTTLPKFLHERDASYHGIDWKQSTVDAMRENLAAEGLPPNVSQGDMLRLPCGDEDFDYVHERLVLMHVPDPARGIRECIRVARKAAFFVSVDWSQFKCGDPWVDEAFREFVRFDKDRGSDLCFGERILSLIPKGVRFSVVPYPRPYGDHGYIIADMCGSLAGQLKNERPSERNHRLLKYFTETAERAKREGAWLTPALMSVVTVYK